GPVELLRRVEHDVGGARVDRRRELLVRLVVAVHDEALAGHAGPLREAELAQRRNVGAEALLREKPQDRDGRKRLRAVDDERMRRRPWWKRTFAPGSTSARTCATIFFGSGGSCQSNDCTDQSTVASSRQSAATRAKRPGSEPYGGLSSVGRRPVTRSITSFVRATSSRSVVSSRVRSASMCVHVWLPSSCPRSAVSRAISGIGSIQEPMPQKVPRARD